MVLKREVSPLFTSLLFLGLLAFSGCSHDATNTSVRRAGEPLTGLWYLPFNNEACTWDAVVLGFEGGKITYRTGDKAWVFQEFTLKNQSVDKFTMVVEHVRGAYRGAINEFEYEDRGSALIAVTIDGKNAAKLKQATKNFDYKSCENISVWSSLKLKLGLSKEYSKNPTLEN
jgi:hypothetical protein